MSVRGASGGARGEESHPSGPFHLAEPVVFIIPPGEGWGPVAGPVAFLLNKMKYLETEWETPGGGLS